MPGPLAALLRLAGDDGEGAAGNAPRGTEAAAQGPPTSPLADAAASLARERAMRLQAEAGCADACMLLEDAQAALSGAVALKDERDRLHAQLSSERAERRRLADALRAARDETAAMEQEFAQLAAARAEDARSAVDMKGTTSAQSVQAARVLEELARTEDLERRVNASEASATAAETKAAAAERRAEELAHQLRLAQEDAARNAAALEAERAQTDALTRRCRELERAAKEAERLKHRQVLLEGANFELRRQVETGIAAPNGPGADANGAGVMREVSLMADAIDGMLSATPAPQMAPAAAPPAPLPSAISAHDLGRMVGTSFGQENADDTDDDEDAALLQLTKDVSTLGRVALASLQQQVPPAL